MKILVFSDSHGYTNNMVRAINKHKDAQMVIHLGDVLRDAIKIRDTFNDINVEFVQGNNDWSNEFPKEKVLLVEGKKIFITHGHLYSVKSGYQKIIEKGKSINADAVFFGHTHRVEEQYHDGMLLLNPGSVSLPSGSQSPTCTLVKIMDGLIYCRFMGFD